jgi:small subunit ribosomal protein S2
MALPEFSMRQLLEAGAHFGHRQQRWNPKMAPFIYGQRNDIHILDLTQTVPLLHRALVTLREVAAGGGRILFVGTKRQASEPIAAAAKRCAQYYVNHRWLGGTLTNWQTISHSIRRLRTIEETLTSAGESGLTRRNCWACCASRASWSARWAASRKWAVCGLLFVIDTNKEPLHRRDQRQDEPRARIGIRRLAAVGGRLARPDVDPHDRRDVGDDRQDVARLDARDELARDVAVRPAVGSGVDVGEASEVVLEDLRPQAEAAAAEAPASA